jgi:hypothetical protein
MKAIEGISLKDIVTGIEHELVAEKKHEVAKQIRGIFLDIHNWSKQLEDAKRTQAKLEAKIAKAEAKKKALLEENWAVLGDNNPQSNQKSKEETEDDI